MHLTLYRYNTTPEYTAGVLHINGGFHCYTLEDTQNPIKVPGKTRIDSGYFWLDWRDGSPMARNYAARYAWHRRGMIWITGTPRHTYAYFHPGNTPEDTKGCILVGSSVSGTGNLMASVGAYKALYERAAFEIGKRGQSTLRICNLG